MAFRQPWAVSGNILSNASIERSHRLFVVHVPLRDEMMQLNVKLHSLRRGQLNRIERGVKVHADLELLRHRKQRLAADWFGFCHSYVMRKSPAASAQPTARSHGIRRERKSL